MSRHDETPITSRVIPPSHPAIQGAQRRLISEIDEWLEQDEDYTPRSLADDLADDEKLIHFANVLALTLLVPVVAFLVIQVAWQLGKVLV